MLLSCSNLSLTLFSTGVGTMVAAAAVAAIAAPFSLDLPRLRRNRIPLPVNLSPPEELSA